MAKNIPGVRWDAKREKWFIDYYDGHGRRHREYGLRGRSFKSQKEAGDALASRKASILANRYEWKAREGSVPFGEILDWYLKTYSPEKRSHKRDLVSAKPLRAYFGARLVAEITASDVQAYKVRRRQTMSWRTKRPISEATVDLELNLLKAVFSRAIEDEEKRKTVKGNPVKEVKLYRPDNRRSRTLSAAEMAGLSEKLAPHVRPLVRVILETGLRVGEALALRRADIRFKDGGAILRIRRKGGRQQDIPVSVNLTKALHAVVKSLPVSEGSAAPLWRKPNGQPLRNFRTAWENAREKVNATDLWLHDLRRTFGTYALQDGADLVTLREILGHSNVSTTERYLCPEAKRQREAVESVSARLLGSGWAARPSESGVDIEGNLLETKGRAGVAELADARDLKSLGP